MNKLTTLGLLPIAGILLAASSAHADPYWQQQPGLALDIGVDAEDTPYIVDLNGYIQYGTPHSVIVDGLYVTDGTVDWHILGNGGATHIGVGLDSGVIYTNSSGELFTDVARNSCSYTFGTWMNCFWAWQGMPTTYSGGTAQISQVAVGVGTASSVAVAATLFGLSPNSLLWKLSTNFIPGAPPKLSPAVWQYDGGVGSSVALFSENSGSVTTQVAWLVDGFGFAEVSTPGGFATVERPTWSGGGAVGPVTGITDSWMLAENWVWHWKAGAGAERKTGVANQDYDEVLGGSSSMRIVKIAFASPYPSIGWQTGSRLWVLDSQNRIYTLEHATQINGYNGK